MNADRDRLATNSLRGAKVLVVEDEPFIAFDLVHSIESAGGIALGPAASVSQALVIVQTNDVDAAILDVDLSDGHVGPVLETLRPLIAIVIHSGVGLPAELSRLFPDIPVYSKPTPPQKLTEKLAAMLKARDYS